MICIVKFSFIYKLYLLQKLELLMKLIIIISRWKWWNQRVKLEHKTI
jgi:hypothetical protein